MNGYVDLWVNVSSDLDRIASIARLMGYIFIGLEDQGFKWKVREVNNVKFVKRITIEARSEKEIREKVRGIKVYYPIVAVKPLSTQVARFAARDGRVDLVVLDRDTIEYIDKIQAGMMKQFGKPLEVCINCFLKASSREKGMIFRRIRLFHYYSVPIIYSSGASRWNELIHPKGISALLSTLVDVPKASIVYGLSSIPLEILTKNGVR